MPIRERFTQPHAVAVRVGGHIKRRQPLPIALTVGLPAIGPLLFEHGAENLMLNPVSRSVGARPPGRSPPRRALRKL